MNTPRAVLLVILTVLGFALAVPTAAAPTPDAPTDISSTSLQSEQQATNTTLGAEVSSFMQVSTSQAKGTVDTGMWVARFNQTKNRSAQRSLVKYRVDDMRKQLTSLENRKRKLVEARKRGEISQLKYQSEMSQLIGEIHALRHSITATRPRAVTLGTSTNELDRLNESARTAGGPEVMEVAKSMHSVQLDVAGSNNTTGTTGNGTTNGTSVGTGTSIGTTGTVGVGNTTLDGGKDDGN